MRNLTKITLSLIAIGLTAGCATGGGSSANSSSTITGKTDPAVGKIYVSGLQVMGRNGAPSARCLAQPADMKGKDWKSLVQHANGCVKDGNWKNLEWLGQEIAAKEINSPWGAYFMSLSAQNAKDLPRALWMIDLSLKKTDAALFHYQKARVLWELENHKDAVGEINAALKRDSAILEAHVFLAQLYHRDMDLDKAQSHYEKALAIDARQRECLEGLGDLRMAQGKHDKAAELYASAVSQARDDFPLRMKLAQTYEGLEGNLEMALSNYRTARDIAFRAKIVAGMDLNEKIKALELQVIESKVEKKVKASEEAKANAPASDKAPASVPNGRKTK